MIDRSLRNWIELKFPLHSGIEISLEQSLLGPGELEGSPNFFYASEQIWFQNRLIVKMFNDKLFSELRWPFFDLIEALDQPIGWLFPEIFVDPKNHFWSFYETENQIQWSFSIQIWFQYFNSGRHWINKAFRILWSRMLSNWSSIKGNNPLGAANEDAVTNGATGHSIDPLW